MISDEKILLLPLALFVSLVVGIPLARERKSAVLPLVAECPSFLYNFLIFDFTPEIIEHTISCMIGVVIFLAIPGAIGIFLLLMKD